MQDKLLRIHHFEPASRANGPGLRAVIWVQGCALGCPGCFNPETHGFDAGEKWTVDQLVERIVELQPTIEGLTISGGEPLYQHAPLARLMEQVRAQTNLSILVFTGYTWGELQQFPGVERFLANVDVLIAGRYEASQRVANGLIGSSNKEVRFLTNRYSMADLDQVPEAEITISPDGEIRFSGIDPLRWGDDAER